MEKSKNNVIKIEENQKSARQKPILISDWGGPWVGIDYAKELTKEVVKDDKKGEALFQSVLRYSNFLAIVRKKGGVNPGYSEALMVPFLLSYNINKRSSEEIVIKHREKFIEGGKEAIKIIKEDLVSSFLVVSNGYCQYVHNTAPSAGIPIDNTRCTNLPIEDLKRIELLAEDKLLVREMAEKIIKMGTLNINLDQAEKDMSPDVKKKVEQMDELLYILHNTSFGRVLQMMRPLGSNGKLEALHDALRKEKTEIKDAVALGDGTVDRDMLRETKKGGGLAIAFNGNAIAVDNANVAAVSTNCMITPILIQIFGRAGIERVRQITTNWNLETLRKEVPNNLDIQIFERFEKTNRQNQPLAYWITAENKVEILDRSKEAKEIIKRKLTE